MFDPTYSHEFRVRPVTRFAVTHYSHRDEGNGRASGGSGEYVEARNRTTANQIAQALGAACPDAKVEIIPEAAPDARDARQMFCAEYRHGESTWGLDFFAIDMADAEAKVASIRESLKLYGSLEAVLPVQENGHTGELPRLRAKGE